MGNLPSSQGPRSFGHGHGAFGGQNTGPFGSPSPGPFGGQNTGAFGSPHPDPFGGLNTGPFGGQYPGQVGGSQDPGQIRAYVQDPFNPHYGLNYGQGMGQNQDPRRVPDFQPVANVSPPPYSQGQGNYPPHGYPQQGFNPGYPQGQNYPGYGPGYQQQGYPGSGYPPPVSPGAGVGQAACCGSCVACLTCLLCSCCQGLMGGMGGGMRDDIGDNGNEVPGTANVSSPHENNDDHT